MEPTIPPPIPSQPQRNWWSRNWKWFVPAGCLSIILLFVAFIVAIMSFAFGIMKSTDVYKDALAKAKTNPAVIEALGLPIKDGFFFSGHTEENGASGTADLSIPISGPKGKGTIYVKAEKSLGRWNYSELVAEIKKTGERIDLTEDTPSNRL
jgi:hypothetical protein